MKRQQMRRFNSPSAAAEDAVVTAPGLTALPHVPKMAVYGHTASMPSPYFVGQTLVTSIDLAGILLLM